jgi:hypothetical protein
MMQRMVGLAGKESARSVLLLRAESLFKCDAVSRTVFYGFIDIFIRIIIQGKNIHITRVIDFKCMGSKVNTNFAEDAT